MILITLEYWFSIIPVIRDSFFSQSGYFGLEMDGEAYLNYEMDENEENVYRHQDLIRSFFGLINGYKVRREEDTDEFVDNDPEIVEYIRVRFSEMDLPNEYHNLMDLLHRHKENALDVSETS